MRFNMFVYFDAHDPLIPCDERLANGRKYRQIMKGAKKYPVQK